MFSLESEVGTGAKELVEKLRTASRVSEGKKLVVLLQVDEYQRAPTASYTIFRECRVLFTEGVMVVPVWSWRIVFGCLPPGHPFFQCCSPLAGIPACWSFSWRRF